MVFKHNISLAMSQPEDCWMTVQPTRLCTSPLRWETTHTSYGQERTRVGQCIFVPVCEFLFYYVWFLQTFSLCHCPTEHSNNFVECSPLSPSFIKHNNFGGIASQPIASTHLLFPEGDYTHWTFSPTNFPFGSLMCDSGISELASTFLPSSTPPSCFSSIADSVLHWRPYFAFNNVNF